MAALFAEHNLAFQISDHLTKVISDSFTDSTIAKEVSLNRKKCSSIVKKIIAKIETEETVSYLKNVKFSILVDESTDICDTKFMCTLVRYVSPTNGSIQTELLELIPLNATDCSAVKIYESFKLCLNQKDIPLQNIIGLGCDGANVMVGNHNSFYSHLKTDVPSVILMKCICHSAAIIASKACEHLLRSTEELLRAVASYVSGSAKRCAQLCEIQDYFNTERKKILKLANTRWLSMHQCVLRILETWDIL